MANNDSTDQNPGDENQAPDTTETQAQTPEPAPQTIEPPRKEIELTPHQAHEPEPEVIKPDEEPEPDEEIEPGPTRIDRAKQYSGWLFGAMKKNAEVIAQGEACTWGWFISFFGVVLIGLLAIVSVVTIGSAIIVVILILTAIFAGVPAIALLTPTILIYLVSDMLGFTVLPSIYILTTIVWSVKFLPSILKNWQIKLSGGMCLLFDIGPGISPTEIDEDE